MFIKSLAQKHKSQMQKYLKRNTKQSKHIRYSITTSSSSNYSNDDDDDEYNNKKSSAGTTAPVSTPDYITGYAGADSATTV